MNNQHQFVETFKEAESLCTTVSNTGTGSKILLQALLQIQ
jgi:hypothetical protein